MTNPELSPSSPSTLERDGAVAVNAGGVAAESFAEAYVQLNTQLLRCLQHRDTRAALQVAEAVRTLCLGPTASPAEDANGTLRDSVESTEVSNRVALFRGCPAAHLLEMQAELLMLETSPASAGGADKEGEDDADMSADDGSDNDTEGDSSEDDEAEEDAEEDDDSEGQRSNESVNEGDSKRSVSQGAAQHLLGALAAWSRASKRVTVASSSVSPSCTLARQNPVDITQTHGQGDVQFATRAPLVLDVGPRAISTSTLTGKPDVTRQTVTSSSLAPNVHDSNNSEEVDKESEELWDRMQADVAKEMERLAVVRKHR